MRPLQRAVSFVTEAVLVASGREPARLRPEPHILTFPSGSSARLHSDSRLSLRFRHRYTIVEAEGEYGPWTVRSTEYLYEFFNQEERSILAYHWHPNSRSHVTWPHLHVPQTMPFDLSRAHAPTGRVSVEAVVRFAIEDLGVRPSRENWRSAVEQGEQVFRRWRTWA